MKQSAKSVVMWVRRVLAAITLVTFSALFLGVSGGAAKLLVTVAKWEFVPALLAGNIIAAGGIILMTLLVGRLYCGMCCPLGILQDVGWKLARLKGQGAKAKPAGTVQLVVRVVVLVVALAVGLLGFGYSWLEPYGIFGRGLSAVTLNAPVWAIAAQLCLIIVIFALAVWKGRVWCNWICPVGTLLGFCSVAAPLGLKIDPKKCIGCRKCERSCRAGAITITGNGEGGKIDRTKCVQCRDCTVLCPKNAISSASFRRPAAPAPTNEPSNDKTIKPSNDKTTMTRREFIVGTGAIGATLVAKAADEKIFDGGFAEVSEPGIVTRNSSLKPAGAHSLKNFREKCVGCQLCVKMCPNHVLRPSMRLSDFMQPEMAFDKGFCTPDCTRCSQVCPAGAITPMFPGDKLHTHIGEAVWHSDRCLAATEGVNCTACFRHCPVRAISRVKNDSGVLIPVVDSFTCVGCGACEHICPARPMPAMTVKAFERHREFMKMNPSDALDEAISLIEKDGKACVLIKDGVFTDIRDGRGVSPLLDILDTDPDDMKDAFLVDKVIGRAAAAICVVAGIKGVHGITVSADGAAFLAAHDIPCTANNTVPKILNRERNGLCPLETACQGLDDPAQMVAAIRAKIAELRR